jgi:hypothetical protein
MRQQSDEEVLLRNYLLGDLDEARREQVEERLLCDDGFAEKLSAAQDALIDDYTFNALSENERESFDKNFILDEERRRKMVFAQTFEVYVDERYESRPPTRDESRLSPASWSNPWPFLRAHKAWASAAAIVLLLLFLTPAMLRRLRSPDEAALVRERRERIERQVAELNQRRADGSVPSLPALELALQPTLLREDGGLKRAVLSNDIKLLTLKLMLPQVRHENYRALVLTVEGDELFAADALTAEPEAGVATVLLNIPTEFLTTGDYQIQLRGKEADGRLAEAVRYNFRIIDKK